MVSTVTVVSVSSPGEMEVKLMSGGLSRSGPPRLFEAVWRLILGLRSSVLVTLGSDSVSGVPSTEILLRDMESSEDNVLEDTAWDPYPLK